MQVFVNDRPVEVVVGMQVKHALSAAGEMAQIARNLKPYDAWGHELGLDGALVEGMKIYLRQIKS